MSENFHKPGIRGALSVAIALSIGLLIGSWHRLAEWYGVRTPEPATAATSQAATADSLQTEALPETSRRSTRRDDATKSRHAARLPVAQLDDQQADVIQASTGVAFIPVRNAGTFVGFEIVRNQYDTRFSVGDIIAGINGVPVEDSPAGGELLIIALTDESSYFQFANR
jgi:hypothetical protein